MKQGHHHHAIQASMQLHCHQQSHHFPTSQQEMDLAQFGLVFGQNGQITSSSSGSSKVGGGHQQYVGQQRQPPSRPPPPFPVFPSISSNNPFLTTPGNSFGLGPAAASAAAATTGKLISTSPIPPTCLTPAAAVGGGCPSPVFSGPAAVTAQPAAAPPLAAVAAVPGGQQSLLPVPHSPMLPQNGMEASAFNFNNPWMGGYYEASGNNPNQPNI